MFELVFCNNINIVFLETKLDIFWRSPYLGFIFCILNKPDEVELLCTVSMLTTCPFGAFSRQPLNYERKKTYTLHIEGMNTHVDPRFSYLGSFKDTATLKITVGDVDEAPVFSMDPYIMDVYENALSGTEVGTVTAQDPDSRNSPVR